MARSSVCRFGIPLVSSALKLSHRLIIVVLWGYFQSMLSMMLLLLIIYAIGTSKLRQILLPILQSFLLEINVTINWRKAKLIVLREKLVHNKDNNWQNNWVCSFFRLALRIMQEFNNVLLKWLDKLRSNYFQINRSV